MKKSRMLLLLTFLAVLTLFSACTRKNNLTGNNWSDVKPRTFTDSLFTEGFSFADTAKVSGYESTLLCGKMGDREAVAMMRFTGLPADSLLATVTEAKLTLKFKRRSPEPRSTLKLNLFRLRGHWTADSTYAVVDDSIVVFDPAIPEYTVPDVSADSTYSITIPNDVISSWSDDTATGFCIAMRSSENGWSEIYSIDSGSSGPKLSFKYRLTTDSATSTLKEYSSSAVSDSYRITAPFGSELNNRWLIRNINPSRLYVKFAVNPSSFRGMNGAPLDSLSLKRLTINKAELVLYKKTNPYYGSSIPYGLKAYNVTRDSLSSAISLQEGDYELMTLNPSSTGFINADSVVVNVTAMVQGYISGDIPNYGVMIQSTQEMTNFGELELWHFADPALPQGKAPKLRVKYTPPFLP
ncbi:MAG TPA: hypothetical protein PKI15_01255 [Candidatus Cloacimonadota bacterium]|nr:hypothetical protein [Candidatus Cloacimonadota bacterium]